MAFNDPHYTPIYKQTVAILFLGTPHRGAGKADQADLAATIIGVLNTAEFMTGRAVIRRDLIKTLKSHSRDLERLSEAFSHRAKDFEIVTFYEGRPSPLSNSVVCFHCLAVTSSLTAYSWFRSILLLFTMR
jgi:hypothetical protein